MGSKQKRLTILSSIIIGVLIIGGGAYFLQKNNPIPQFVSSPVNEPGVIKIDSEGRYTKDATGHVYYLNHEIIGADAQTFSILPLPVNTAPNSSKFVAATFSKDKNRIYGLGEPLSMEPAELSQPDLQTFSIIGYAYAKDKSHIYSIADYSSDYNKVRIVNGADLKTFKEIISQYSGNLPGYAYAKDISHVYFYNSILQGVDSETFEFIAGGSCGYETEKCWPRVTKDKNCIYHDNKKVLGTDGVCINPIQCTKATTNTSCGIK